jgi:hypothetical protein
MNPIDEAARNLEIAKFAEAKATAERIRAENQLVELIPAKTEGSVSMKGADYKVSITYAMNRTVDAPALAAIWSDLSEGMRRVFPIKHGLDTKELRHWQNNEPESYALIAQVITSKPAKPSVKIERVAEEMREAA